MTAIGPLLLGGVGLWTLGLLLVLARPAGGARDRTVPPGTAGQAALGLAYFGRVLGAVLAFEVLTEAMVDEVLTHPWTYLYKDVSWLLAIAWTDAIVTATLIAGLGDGGSEGWNYAITVQLALAIGIGLEIGLVKAGVHRFPPALLEGHLGLGSLGRSGAPVEALYYMSVFVASAVGLARALGLPAPGEPIERCRP